MHHLEDFRKNVLILLAVFQHCIHRFRKIYLLLLIYVLALQKHLGQCFALGLGQRCFIVTIQLLEEILEYFELLFFECQLVGLQKVLCLADGYRKLSLLDNFVNCFRFLVTKEIGKYPSELAFLEVFSDSFTLESRSYLSSKLLALVIILFVEMIF